MRIQLALSLLAATTIRASAPIPFSSLFRVADTAFIGDIESAKLVPADDTKASAFPVLHRDNYTLYPCELDIPVKRLFKQPDLKLRVGAVASVISYAPSIACSLGPGTTQGPSRSALWLLRTDGGVLRTLEDTSATVFTPQTGVFPFLRDLLPFEQHDLERWSEPEAAVMYLFLKPGLIISEGQYARSSLPIQMADLAGWTNFLKVYQTAYSESNAYGQGQISLVAATFDYCLATAKRTAQAEGRLSEWVTRIPSLDPNSISRGEEVQLEWMSWKSKEAVLKAFQSSDKARDELTRWACSSLPRVKERARDLLSQYFEVKLSALPCLPCD